MYEPTVGRWSTEDPSGFAAGDADLYRYVGNAPTNFVDPSGLFKVTVDETTGGDPTYQGNVDSADLKGSITVWKGRVIAYSPTSKLNDEVEIRFQSANGMALPKDVHWLQFVKTSYYKDKNTQLPDEVYPVGLDGLHPIVKKTNEWGVDTTDKANPYYDASFASQLGPKGEFLSIFDSPTRDLDSNAKLQKDFASKGVTIARQNLVTYLVYNKKA